MTPGGKDLNTLQYRARKARENHIVPVAPFTFDDGGRQRSKRPRQKNDCTVRAIAIACSISYDCAYDLLKANGRKCSRGIRLRPLLERALLNEYRFEWIAFPAIKGYLRMYPGDFCKIFPRGRWIIKTAKHVSTVVQGPSMTLSGRARSAASMALGNSPGNRTNHDICKLRRAFLDELYKIDRESAPLGARHILITALEHVPKCIIGGTGGATPRRRDETLELDFVAFAP